jgi:hypothetical protein
VVVDLKRTEASFRDSPSFAETHRLTSCGEAMVGFKSLPRCQQGFELRANISPGSAYVKLVLAPIRRRHTPLAGDELEAWDSTCIEARATVRC